MEVVYIQRKPFTVGNYSIETIFSDIHQRLRDQIQVIISISRFESKGVLRRFYNCLEIIPRQREVNHITGDVNYLGLFLHKNRTIQTILDCVYLDQHKGLKAAVLKYFWLTLPVRRCRYVTAISAATKAEILKHCRCEPDKIVVIPVAIASRFQPAEHRFNSLQPRVLQLGTAPNKNLPRLIEALSGLDCCLDIVGRHVPEYEELCRKHNLRYSYSWGLSDEEILRKYQEADIVSLVSTYEGFGMPILEGQTVGRPVMTGNVSSMPEVAGDAACLVDPYDVASIREGFRRVIEDEAYRENLVAKGFENVKRFDPDAIARQYLELYQRVAAGR